MTSTGNSVVARSGPPGITGERVVGRSTSEGQTVPAGVPLELLSCLGCSGGPDLQQLADQKVF